MALAGGDELGQLLDEQAAYYQALGGSYLEKGLGGHQGHRHVRALLLGRGRP